MRDRGRGSHGGRGGSGHSRDAYRERRVETDPERNLSDQSRDQQSSGSFNRSLSNTDMTPDDKIGMLDAQLKQ